MSDSEVLQQLSMDMALVKQAVMGNGVKGLNDRVNDLEEWQHTHPVVCPLAGHTAMTMPLQGARKVSMLTVLFGVLASGGMVVSLIVAIWALLR
jgi:hypothetical protein